MKISIEFLKCITCGSTTLLFQEEQFKCQHCFTIYPMVDGIPIFLNEARSLFTTLGVQKKNSSGYTEGLSNQIGGFLPSPTRLSQPARTAAGRAFSRMAGIRNRCLVIGAGDSGGLIRELSNLFDEVITTDVVVQPGTMIICDGHDIPLADDSVDAVVVAAVLEHVLDPFRVVSEIGRVLRLGGVVLSATPFIAQVHMGPFDFSRFTDLGHRWLFRNFKEIERGVVAGSGTALLWSLEHFVRGFFRSPVLANISSAIVRLGFFWIKYFDIILCRMPGAYDAAAGYFFVGENVKQPCITPKDLIADYKGIKRPRPT